MNFIKHGYSMARQIQNPINKEPEYFGRSPYTKEEIVDILSDFQRYCATKYSEFKNDLKDHLKKHGELRGLSSISVEH